MSLRKMRSCGQSIMRITTGENQRGRSLLQRDAETWSVGLVVYNDDRLIARILILYQATDLMKGARGQLIAFIVSVNRRTMVRLSKLWQRFRSDAGVPFYGTSCNGIMKRMAQTKTHICCVQKMCDMYSAGSKTTLCLKGGNSDGLVWKLEYVYFVIVGLVCRKQRRLLCQFHFVKEPTPISSALRRSREICSRPAAESNSYSFFF